MIAFPNISVGEEFTLKELSDIYKKCSDRVIKTIAKTLEKNVAYDVVYLQSGNVVWMFHRDPGETKYMAMTEYKDELV
jgi:hypothetical protein